MIDKRIRILGVGTFISSVLFFCFRWGWTINKSTSGAQK